MIARRWREGRWFLVALLLALASALVPALCASGPPASRLTGSAFDPTTSAVALRGRAQAIIRAEAAPDQDAAPATPLIAMRPAAPILQGHAGPILAAAPGPDAAAPPLAIETLTRARPRAPPIANG